MLLSHDHGGRPPGSAAHPPPGCAVGALAEHGLHVDVARQAGEDLVGIALLVQAGVQQGRGVAVAQQAGVRDHRAVPGDLAELDALRGGDQGGVTHLRVVVVMDDVLPFPAQTLHGRSCRWGPRPAS